MRAIARVVACIGVASVISACTATPEPATTTAEARPAGMVCTQERPTGSHIAVTKCRTPEQVEREREAATSTLGSPTRSANPSTYKAGS